MEQRDLRALRQERGYGQRGWSRLLGITQAEISRLERGQHKPQTRTIRAYAEACDLSEDEIRAAVLASRSSSATAAVSRPTGQLRAMIDDLLAPQTEYQLAAISGLARSLAARMWSSWASNRDIDWTELAYAAAQREAAVRVAPSAPSPSAAHDEFAHLGRDLVVEHLRIIRLVSQIADRRVPIRVSPSLWQRALTKLVTAARAGIRIDFDYSREVVYSGIFSQAREHPHAFEDARTTFLAEVHDLTRARIREGAEVTPPIYRLYATEHFLNGTSDGVRQYMRSALEEELLEPQRRDPQPAVPLLVEDGGAAEYITLPAEEPGLLLVPA